MKLRHKKRKLKGSQKMLLKQNRMLFRLLEIVVGQLPASGVPNPSAVTPVVDSAPVDSADAPSVAAAPDAIASAMPTPAASALVVPAAPVSVEPAVPNVITPASVVPIPVALAPDTSVPVAPVSAAPAPVAPALAAPAAGPPEAIVIHDSSGQEITAATIKRLLGPFFFMSLPMLSTMYRHEHGHDMVPEGANLNDVRRALHAMPGLAVFMYQPHIERATTIEAAHNDYLQIANHDFMRKRQSIQHQLLLTRDVIPPIPAPLLFYHMAMFGCVQFSRIRQSILVDASAEILGDRIESMRVAMRNGIYDLTELQVMMLETGYATCAGLPSKPAA
ncbi:hypothetical protein GGH91_002581 [Coemansia sp. RSA 2671]|uniref:Uncharacterized protein n=1 Tax=Coemansia linderi TaxID=2663919 RepID=A0ACC1KFV7_9FUNG|nr:hypothetical protein GGH91_002581 [Coemansia sp. RSA 2671]KAJ2789352.1 hypothetical protein GGI18_002455 [Coemansia linderi]